MELNEFDSYDLTKARRTLGVSANHAAALIGDAVQFEASLVRSRVELERGYWHEEVKEAPAFGAIIGRSPALQRTLQHIEMVAPTDAAVLILGESGTGKELIAGAIHEHSTRRGRPFVRVNCGSIPSELFESEFFGHCKGSFTGALRERIGRFQLADGGTLFLDEIGEIPIAHQAKLLRVLQEGQFERVGDDNTRTVNVRIIAATNCDLRREVATKRFRQDLFYRISVFPIEVPPLRDRLEDIPALAAHFVKLFCRRLNRTEICLTNEDAQLLKQHAWPGNVRELQNVIQRAVILARTSRLCLNLALQYSRPGETLPDQQSQTPSLFSHPRIIRSEALRQLERTSIETALEATHGKVSGPGGAAELLGLNASTLFSRMRSLGTQRKSRAHQSGTQRLTTGSEDPNVMARIPLE